MRVGNKINSGLNGEWAKHVRGLMKKMTSSIRRNENKRVIGEEIDDSTVYTSAGYRLEVNDDTGEVGIRCWDCGLTSYNINDIAHRFCGRCDKYHGKKKKK